MIATLAHGPTDPAAAESGPYNINAGVLLVNLGHPIGRALVTEWHQRYLDVPEYIVRQAEQFETGMPSDQELLIRLLAETPQFLRHLHHSDRDIINSSWAQFIRQELRAMHSSFAERLSAISIGVAGVMQKSASVFDRTQGSTERREWGDARAAYHRRWAAPSARHRLMFLGTI